MEKEKYKSDWTSDLNRWIDYNVFVVILIWGVSRSEANLN